MVSVFSCVGSGDPCMENVGLLAAFVFVPPFDATLSSGFAPCGHGPPGCLAARMISMGPSWDAAATLVLGGLTRCESSPCFQPLWMRQPAATLAAVWIDGDVFLGGLTRCESSPCLQPLCFREPAVTLAVMWIDDDVYVLAAIKGDVLGSGCFPCGGSPSGYRAARMISASGNAASLVTSGGLACGASSFQDVKENSSFTSSCKQETDSFVKGKSCEQLFPMFAGLAAERGLCMASAGNFLRFAASVTESGDDKIDGSGLGASANVSDDTKFDSSSCAVASSSNEASICVGTCEKQKVIQFFVNKGEGSVVVRCSPHAIVSHVLDYGSEGYAVCGTRTLRPGDSFQQNGIESGMTVRLLFRLRGGSGGNNVDIPGQWQCNFCHATRCWPTRKRCYRCDTPRDFSVPDGPVRGPLGRAPPPARNNVPPTRSSGPGPQTVPPRNLGNVPPPQRSPPGAGVGPISADIGKKDEGGDLVQALSLLQKIMTPEDFVKYQLLVSPKPKPKPEKTREQELADKVKSLERYRSQEASHKGMIDKLELDLQRQRNMLRGLSSRFGWLMMRSKISGCKLRKKSLIVVMVTMLLFGLLQQRRLILSLIWVKMGWWSLPMLQHLCTRVPLKVVMRICSAVPLRQRMKGMCVVMVFGKDAVVGLLRKGGS